MTIRALVYAFVALVVWGPAAAGAATVVATVSAPADLPAGSTVQVVCRAEGRNASLMSGGESMQHVDVTVSGGSVSPARIQGPAVQSTTCSGGLSACNVVEGTATWTTPAAPGTLTATCTATYLGGFSGQNVYTLAGTATLTTVAGGTLPPVVGGISGPSRLVAGTAAVYSVTASDPNAPPNPLTYAWSASGGTLTPDPANPASASWLAPGAPGTYPLTVTVSNGAVSSVSTTSVAVVLAAYQSALPVPVVAPRRLAVGEGGELFLVDGDQGASGRVAILTPRGEAKGFAALPEPALALAEGAGVLWVTTAKGSVFKVDPRYGQVAGKVPLAGGAFVRPAGIAYDAANMALWVADTDANRVRVVRPDGGIVAVIDGAGGAPLAAPLDVGIDAAGGRAWVLAGTAKGALGAGEPLAAASFLHAFDLATRQYLGSFAQSGTGPGQLTRVGGLAVGRDGKVYVSDIFQGAVQVYGRDGTPVGTVGEFGRTAGQLMNPMGLAPLANGDLAVANASLGRVDRFGNGAPLPTCAGDADCDGMPDAWELARGLNPRWAGDALLDTDGDGLSNLREYALGTDPRNRDTDGDGFPDGDEVLAGHDPLDPNDHRPVVAASGPARTPPGLVRLHATASGGSCAFEWTQVAGPGVALRDAGTASASFVARAVGSYAFEVVAACGAARTAPGRVDVAVENRPPLADAGRVTVVRPGASVRLDASFSSDANGDALAFEWDQTLGKPLVGVENGAVLTAQPRGAGLYAFQVTVSDGRGGRTAAEVPVLVAGEEAPTAVAVARPAEAEAGATVILDASASPVEEGSAFSWQQVAGADVEILGRDQPVAAFVPPAAGRYRFQVSVVREGLRSPPAEVDVFVAEAGKAIPAVTATAAAAVVGVGGATALEATGTGAGLQYAWRQVSGPAAGLTSDDAPSATVVPFAPGFHVFEVVVRDGLAESRPARVAFEARAGGKPIPRAVAVAPRATAQVEDLVFLDGRGSTGARRHRWTQVSGAWVALGTEGGVAFFRPREPGAYAFELEVDDGTTRSAPARVEVQVDDGATRGAARGRRDRKKEEK